MVLSNAFNPDPRVYKEAKSLVEHGFKVTVYAWDRECKYSQNEIIDGIIIQRLHLKSKYGNFFTFLITVPIFWILASLRILSKKVDVIHCHDFDTLIVGLAMKLIKKGVKLVYDSHECYSLMISQVVPKSISLVVEWLQRLLFSFADATIAASDDILYRFVNHPHSTVIHNYPVLKYISDRSFEKRVFHKEKYSVVYSGKHLSEDRCILELVKAITELNKEFEVTLKLTGKFLSETFKRKVEAEGGYMYIDFLGWLPKHQQVIEEMYKADIGFLCVRSDNQVVAATRSNRLFESMAAGLPIIASNFPEWKRVVEGVGCGVTADPWSVSDIEESLANLLADPDLRKRMSRNAVQAIKEKYNWEAENQKLLDFYERILSD